MPAVFQLPKIPDLSDSESISGDLKMFFLTFGGTYVTFYTPCNKLHRESPCHSVCLSINSIQLKKL